MAFDVTDANFETEVLQRSLTAAVVIDLWAPWCGPCTTLGPILEKACDATGGEVVLAKVNIDENPNIAAAFRVQSIPAVFAMRDGQVVDGFVGARPAHLVHEFITALRPTEAGQTMARLLEAGDEDSLRAALELDPAHEGAIVALADVLVNSQRADEALALLARIPETDAVRVVAAKARLGMEPDDDFSAELDGLLERVKGDDEARQRFVDILELMGALDPRTAVYRKHLTARLY